MQISKVFVPLHDKPIIPQVWDSLAPPASPLIENTTQKVGYFSKEFQCLQQELLISECINLSPSNTWLEISGWWWCVSGDGGKYLSRLTSHIATEIYLSDSTRLETIKLIINIPDFDNLVISSEQSNYLHLELRWDTIFSSKLTI